jgi:hypothetical protein
MTAPDVMPPRTKGGTSGFSNLRTAAAISLTMLCLGCVTSKQPLFDPANSTTPFSNASFAEEQNKNGHWIKSETVKLIQDGRAYGVERGGDKTFRLALHDIANGFYVGVRTDDAAPASTPQFSYVLFAKRGEGFVSYLPVCKDFQFLRLSRELWPLIDGTNCVYDNREKLIQALLAYASVSEPNSRYIPLKP